MGATLEPTFLANPDFAFPAFQRCLLSATGTTALFPILVHLSVSKVHFGSLLSWCELSLLLSGTEGFSANQLVCQSQQPSPIFNLVMPAIEGLVAVDEIRIETGTVKEPEEHTPPPRLGLAMSHVGPYSLSTAVHVAHMSVVVFHHDGGSNFYVVSCRVGVMTEHQGDAKTPKRANMAITPTTLIFHRMRRHSLPQSFSSRFQAACFNRTSLRSHSTSKEKRANIFTTPQHLHPLPANRIESSSSTRSITFTTVQPMKLPECSQKDPKNIKTSPYKKQVHARTPSALPSSFWKPMLR